MTTSLSDIFKSLATSAINNSNNLFQESLRGTSKEDLFPVIVARAAYHGTMELGRIISKDLYGDYVGAEKQIKFLLDSVLLGLHVLIKGLENGLGLESGAF